MLEACRETEYIIDETFIAQQLKTVSEAKFEAQKKENERIELEANAVAEKARREAKGQADARTLAANAEADAIRAINTAAREAQGNPLLLQLKSLEVEKARIERWDGRYPQWWMAGLIHDEARLHEIGRRGRTLVEDRFTWRAVAGRYEALFLCDCSTACS